MSIVEKAADRLRQDGRNGQARFQGPRIPEGSESRENGSAAVSANEAPQLTLDHRSLRRAGLLPPDAMSQRIAREYQRIKRPILAAVAFEGNAASAKANRLMVTSANAGDGKSFTSMNLALSLANELDYSVLLVDGDVAKPGISRYVGLEKTPGLMDLLLSPERPVEDAIIQTDVPRLSIMSAGKRSEQAAEHLSSRRMESIVNELSADSSRLLVFDSPPLLATAEAQTLALHMGQILMVVRAGKTERRAVESALSLIDEPSATISLVLNQSRKGFGDDYEGYYGYYHNNETEQLD